MSLPLGDNGNGPQDSITLGQLRAMVGTGPKPRQSLFDFKYDDEDTVMNEIEEFYSYIEMPQVAENLKAWEGSYKHGEWTKSTIQQRRTYVEILIESLEHRDTEIRFTNARRLFYVLQGTFSETVSPEHQLHWIFENCKLVRAANGVSSIIEALKIAGHKHDLLCNLTDQDAAHLRITLQDKADLVEEILTEISVYLGMLYHLIEVLKVNDDFADELMSLDPPLPVYLFNLVSSLRDKTAKGYPIKKLLLVLWKTLLTCWGGTRDHARVKRLARELAGLPVADESFKLKSSPLDIETFHSECFVKYPTFTASPDPPPPIANAPIAKLTQPAQLTSRLAKAYSPIPVRHHYHHEDLDQNQGGGGGPSGMPTHFNPHMNPPPHGGPTFRQNPQPATPAPSPPPISPKPKKQQYQTDQLRPFLFPFSNSLFGSNNRLIPFAIDEADRLYSKHMYISLELAQMWRTREDCMTVESGLDRMPGVEDNFKSSTYNLDDNENVEPLPDLALLNEKIEEATKAYEAATAYGDKRRAKELKEDLMRLKRVEQIYSAILPVLSGWVLVLLKLLLATVSASTNLQGPQSSNSSVFPPSAMSPLGPDQGPSVPPTLDEIDVTRHREITSKAVSAILLLVLKWFKVSHAMKFHHLGQHLLDTNCLLLILKMFGLQEVTNTVVSKADSPSNNFFRYCLLNLSKNPQYDRRDVEDDYRPSRQLTRKITILPKGDHREEEVELITEYSWRNFFSTINFAKIMQKLSKGRSHRIWMLVQYKSSAVLKRVLRVNHPMLQLHVLKLIKSQVPFCGRKWRQSNMKVITSIYLSCRPELRDEWLTGVEPDDAGDAQAQEHALRHLVKFYNTKRYGTAATGQQGPMHRRSGSISQIEGLHPDPALQSLIRPLGTPNVVESDVFPPVRSQAPDQSLFLPYIPEDIAFEEEYEEYLSDLGFSDNELHHPPPSSYTDQQQQFGKSGVGTSAWHQLPSFVSEMTDNISDSESVVSIGDLGDEGRLDSTRDEVVDENVNNWEHMSPKTMAALPKSPAGRRSSSGTGLRPVVPFDLNDNDTTDSAVEEEDMDALPHMGREPPSGEFPAGASVDEVEYAYGV